MDIPSLKRDAFEVLKRNLGWILFLFYFNYIAAIINFGAYFSGRLISIQILTTVASLVVEYLSVEFLLNCFNSKTSIGSPQLPTSWDRFIKFFALRIVMNVFISLWSFLFIVPGIIKTFSYAMAPFILINEDLGVLESITKSRFMMYGYKLELFVLGLSFIPWYLLNMLSLGFLSGFINAYISLTVIAFYYSIKDGLVVDM